MTENNLLSIGGKDQSTSRDGEQQRSENAFSKQNIAPGLVSNVERLCKMATIITIIIIMNNNDM